MRFSKKLLTAAIVAAACLSVKAQTLIEKADKQYELHAYRLAAQSYEFILNRDADEWGASARLADCYFHLNDLAKAERWYARAIESGGSNAKPETLLNYGKTLMMLSRYAEAEAQFKKYREKNLTVGNQYVKSCQFAQTNDDNPADLAVTPLSKVNTQASDFGATMTGETMIWSSSRTDLKRQRENGTTNDWTGSNHNQMFVAPLDGVSPAPFKINFYKSDLKNTYNESQPSFSADGKTVAFMRNNFGDGERIASNGGLELSIFIASVDNNGNWRDVRPFPYNAAATGFPCLSPDGKTLYFASNRPGGQGGFDIYQSTLRGTMWGEPRNLGSVINTPGDEITPFTDGKTLYFSSDYHIGFGGFDVFKTEGLGREVENMGVGVNSSGDDFGFVFDNTLGKGFLASNRRGGAGKEDIYRVERQYENVNIVIAENGRPVKDAQVKAISGNAARISQLSSGNWLVDLSDKKPFELEISKTGFISRKVTIEPTFIKSSRILEVPLERDVPTAMSKIPVSKGIIFDASTGTPLEGVLVRAVNQNGNSKTETATTDKNGNYSLTLLPAANYIITYSKAGFIVSKSKIAAGSIKGNALEAVSLSPSAVNERSDLLADTPVAKKSNDATPSGKGGQPAKNDVPEAYSITTKSAGGKAVAVNEPQEVQGYSVQVFVSGSDDAISLNKFDNIKNSGNVYLITEGGKQKVRVGVFATKQEASAVLSKIKEEGYTSAFVVQEYSAKAASNNAYKAPQQTVDKKTSLPQPKSPASVQPKSANQPPKPKSNPSSKTTPKSGVSSVPESYNTIAKPSVPAETPAPSVKEDKSFKVKIATMRNPKSFDDSKVSRYWKIDTVKSGEFTYFIMDGIKTLAQAKDLKSKVKASGYTDARVVILEDGKFKVVD